MVDDDGPVEKVIEGGNVFRLVRNGNYVGLLIDCGSEAAAKVGYDEILKSCRERGGVNITVQGVPDTTPMIFEKGAHYSDDQ